MSKANLRELARFFKIFGDETRLKIIEVLSKEKLSVNDISKKIDMSQSATSHQLRLLKDNRLVRYDKEGKEIFYELDDDHVMNIFMQGVDHISHG